MTVKTFRVWLADVWQDNCEENDGWGQPSFQLTNIIGKFHGTICPTTPIGSRST